MPVRHQHGHLRCVKRRSVPPRCEFLWRENNSSGTRIRRNAVVGCPYRKYHPRFNYLYLELLGLTGKSNSVWHRLGRRITVEPYPERYMILIGLNPKSVSLGNCGRTFSSRAQDHCSKRTEIRERSRPRCRAKLVIT